MLDITSEDAILLAASLIIGMLISWLISRPRIGRRNDYIGELEDTIKSNEKKLKDQNKTLKEQEASLNDLNAGLQERAELVNRAKEKFIEQKNRIETLETSQKNKDTELKDLTERVQEQDSTIESLRAELDQREEAISNLEDQLQELNNDTSAVKQEIADLNDHTLQMISERDTQIETLTKSIKSRDENIVHLNKRLQEQETTVKDINTQLSQRDTIIQGLNFQILEQNHQINNLKEEKADLDECIQKLMTSVEETETREAELGKMLQEEERELKTLQERALRMHDDLTHIAGIGVKISSVLRSAGIDTFEKLATTKVDSIRKILEAENPSLLRLTDPSTWPEQARIAADGDWEALSNLQNKIKAKRD